MKERNPLTALDSILDAVGRTPLVRLRKITTGISSSIYAKLEFLNPMGSVKDRVAKYMIEQAVRDGRVRDGQLIIENSSGNTAMGLALVAIQKGYRLKVVVRDSISPEKLAQLRALGVEVHQVDHTIPPDNPCSYNNITPRMVAETPGCYFPDQHNNRENNDTHYNETGPEIWEQMEGRIDYLVAGVGTGGTLCGSARFLKEQDPGITIIGVDPVGSVFHGWFHRKELVSPKPYEVEGLGDEFLIKTMNFDMLDDLYQVTDEESFHWARRLVREEGVMAGGSSGAAIWAAMRLARSQDEPKRIVTIFPDGAARYMSRLFPPEQA